MIKMFINNEEVVSQNEFTINEEMLSASSTILNNCYPKSWEFDKDYVSRFYYPKDYSKFELINEGNEVILSISGTSPQFETNEEKEWQNFTIYGKTIQNGTPSPYEKQEFVNVGKYNNLTNKYDIEIITQDINGNSKNNVYKLDKPLRSFNGINDTLYADKNNIIIERNVGSVIIDGTENWRVNTDGDITNGVSMELTISNQEVVKCDYFEFIEYDNVTSSSLNFITFDENHLILNIDKTLLSSPNIAGFKSWLLTNNVEMQYLLNSTSITTLTNNEMPITYNGINNIELSIGNITTVIDIRYYKRQYDVLFAGIVKNSGDISLNPRYPHYCSLQILDYKTFLSESDTLDYVINNKTIAEAIGMVVSSVSDYGFIVGNIDISSANDIIGAYSTLNKTAYDVLQYLADISGSRWRARYVDSDTMAIDFYDPDTLPQASNIEYTKAYWESNNIVDLKFSYGTRDYRNKQIILSNEVYGSIDYTEVLLSNGYNTSFITQQNVGIVNSVTVNGVEKDVISQKEKELGADADFYYTPGKNIVESASSYTAGTQIAINYTPLVKGRQIVYNDEEVTRIATQTNTLGVISRYESRNDIVSSQELQQIGETYIEYKGKAEVILTLTTQNNDLYNIGEVVYFNAPIEELQQKYMVKSKKIEYVVIKNVVNLFYVYELTSSFNSEKAINYFDNQRNKAQGNIQEGESITRNIDINNSAVIIWNNPTIEEISVTVDGNNALNSVLNSPFIE